MKLGRSRRYVLNCSAIIFILLEGLISAQQLEAKPSLSQDGGDVSTYPLLYSSLRKREASGKNDEGGGGGAATSTAEDVKKLNGSSNSTVAVPVPVTKAAHKVHEKFLFIPDRSPANLTVAQMKDENFSSDDELENAADARPGDKFDEKAFQRALVVIGGIVLIIVAYLGVKMYLIKKRKVVKRYGRIESSEMDLLDEVEEEEESEEEEELFDINQQRRS